MKTLKDLEENIYKCSKCGLCQKVCPLYKVTGNECTLSRGKFTLLNGVVKKHIPLDKNVMKYVNLCLNCNACKNFCPSNIDAREIFASIKAENSSAKKRIIPAHLLMEGLLKVCYVFISLYKLSGMRFLSEKFANILIKTGKPGRFLLILNAAIGRNIKRRKNNSSVKNKTVVYFPGCVGKYINKSEKNSVLNILDTLGCKVIEPDFVCCGMPYYSKGEVRELKELVNLNLSKIPDDFDYFITNCASCEYMLSKYSEFAGDKNLPKVKLLKEKSISFADFLSQNQYRAEAKEQVNITIHKPCHYESDIKEFLTNSKNLNYVEMAEYDSCCGASGSFMMEYPQISKSISKIKAQNILDTKADIVLTSCPACVIGLKRGLVNTGDTKTEVMNISEFLGLLAH